MGLARISILRPLSPTPVRRHSEFNSEFGAPGVSWAR